MHLKVDKQNECDAWVASITGLTDFYRSKKIFEFLDERTDYKSEVDIRITVLVMKEQESTQTIYSLEIFKAELEKKLDFEKQLIDKDVKSYILNIEQDIIKRRLFASMVKFTSGHQIDKEAIETKEGQEGNFISTGLSMVIPSSLIFWQTAFLVIITSKSYV